MDIIFLKELKAECVVGVWGWEHQIRQRISIDLEMGVDIKRAADSDKLDDTLNYKAVVKRVIAFVEDSRFHLIETLAEGIADLLKGEFDIPWCRVTVDKGGAVRGARAVGVVIERGRKDA